MSDDIVTYKGLHKWYHKSFCKLGWIVLASTHTKYAHRVGEYKKSISLLKDAIDGKIVITNDADHIKDLNIMLSNVKKLITFVDNASFPPSATGGKPRKSRK